LGEQVRNGDDFGDFAALDLKVIDAVVVSPFKLIVDLALVTLVPAMLAGVSHVNVGHLAVVAVVEGGRWSSTG
jgi:hypothetical protein